MVNDDGEEAILKGDLPSLARPLVSYEESDKLFETITLGCHSGRLASSSDTFCR